MRATYAEINLSHLKSNYLNIRRKVGKSKIMAVVKADAYGHGMRECVLSLMKLGDKKPEYYGVALIEEAVELRKTCNCKEPIVSFAPLLIDDLDEYYTYNIMPTICTEEHIKKLKKLNSNRKLKVHINIDTGMGRLGFHYSKALHAIRRISEIKSVEIDGIYTHFATADERNKSFAALQLDRFKYIIHILSNENINYGLAHAANSGAILDIPNSYLDMVRPGISLYGYYPSLETTESIKLKPVMSLISGISTIREMRKGETVSYGRLFKANKNLKVATIPIGYADGYFRNLTNKAFVIINGKKYPQIGRVTMDRIMINIGDADLRTGGKVILLGAEKQVKFDGWDWSKILNSIPYEVTCAVSRRVPRRYKN